MVGLDGLFGTDTIVLRIVLKLAQAKRFHPRWHIDAEAPTKSFL